MLFNVLGRQLTYFAGCVSEGVNVALVFLLMSVWVGR